MWRLIEVFYDQKSIKLQVTPPCSSEEMVEAVEEYFGLSQGLCLSFVDQDGDCVPFDAYLPTGKYHLISRPPGSAARASSYDESPLPFADLRRPSLPFSNLIRAPSRAPSRSTSSPNLPNLSLTTSNHALPSLQSSQNPYTFFTPASGSDSSSKHTTPTLSDSGQHGDVTNGPAAQGVVRTHSRDSNHLESLPESESGDPEEDAAADSNEDDEDGDDDDDDDEDDDYEDATKLRRISTSSDGGYSFKKHENNSNCNDNGSNSNHDSSSSVSSSSKFSSGDDTNSSGVGSYATISAAADLTHTTHAAPRTLKERTPPAHPSQLSRLGTDSPDSGEELTLDIGSPGQRERVVLLTTPSPAPDLESQSSLSEHRLRADMCMSLGKLDKVTEEDDAGSEAGDSHGNLLRGRAVEPVRQASQTKRSPRTISGAASDREWLNKPLTPRQESEAEPDNSLKSTSPPTGGTAHVENGAAGAGGNVANVANGVSVSLPASPQMNPLVTPGTPGSRTIAISVGVSPSGRKRSLQINTATEISGSLVAMNELDVHREDFSNSLSPQHYRRDVTLEDFELVKVLGRGAFAKVFLCRKKSTGAFYALKRLKKFALTRRNQVNAVRIEFSILTCLRHPFIVGLHWTFQTEKSLWFVLDFCPGGELFQQMRRVKGHRFEEEQMKLPMAELLLALGYLHSNGIVFRDLKPENLMLDADGHLKLIDFGLAKFLDGLQQLVKVSNDVLATPKKPNIDANFTEESMAQHDKLPQRPRTHSLAGSPAYLAPEMITKDRRTKGHNHMVDWWAFGTLLYEVLVGVPPFFTKQLRQTYINIAQGVLRFPPWLSPTCKDLITKLLNRDPGKRLGALRDSTEVKKHAWFDGLDWDHVYRKIYQSPLASQCNTQDDLGVSNFASSFLDEELVDSAEEDPSLDEADDAQQFSWVIPPEVCLKIHDQVASAMVEFPSHPMPLDVTYIIGSFVCPIPEALWPSLMQRFGFISPLARANLTPFKFSQTRTRSLSTVRPPETPRIKTPLGHEGLLYWHDPQPAEVFHGLRSPMGPSADSSHAMRSPNSAHHTVHVSPLVLATSLAAPSAQLSSLSSPPSRRWSTSGTDTTASMTSPAPSSRRRATSMEKSPTVSGRSVKNQSPAIPTRSVNRVSPRSTLTTLPED